MISTPISPDAVTCAVIDDHIYQIDMKSAAINKILRENLDTAHQKAALGGAISVEWREYIIGESCGIEYDSPIFREALDQLTRVEQFSAHIALYFNKLWNLFAIRTTDQENNILVGVSLAI